MPKHVFIFLQYFTPHHWLTHFMGWLAESETPWLKNFLIKRFLKRYAVNLHEARIENPLSYSSFNQFFIRQLKPALRTICKEPFAVSSPVDGTLTQIGSIQTNQLLQAKNHYYDLEGILGNEKHLAKHFYNGCYATFYLAPQNYHRVHMPLDGQLEQTIYIPGRLFSVNLITTDYVPRLFSRNERLVAVFNTEAGKMAVILVGAMIVGNIQTTWLKQPLREKKIFVIPTQQDIKLSQGAELGYFKVGSTVILLFEKSRIIWTPSLKASSMIHLGERLGRINDPQSKKPYEY